MYAFVHLLSLCCILKQVQMLVQITTVAAQNCVSLFQMAPCVYVVMGILCRATYVQPSLITRLLHAVQNVTFSVSITFVVLTTVMCVMVTMIVVMVRMKTHKLEEDVVSSNLLNMPVNMCTGLKKCIHILIHIKYFLHNLLEVQIWVYIESFMTC